MSCCVVCKKRAHLPRSVANTMGEFHNYIKDKGWIIETTNWRSDRGESRQDHTYYCPDHAAGRGD